MTRAHVARAYRVFPAHIAATCEPMERAELTICGLALPRAAAAGEDSTPCPECFAARVTRASYPNRTRTLRRREVRS